MRHTTRYKNRMRSLLLTVIAALVPAVAAHAQCTPTVTGIQSAARWPVSDGIDAARHGNKEEGGEVVARWHRGDASERELHCQRVSA